MNSNCLLLTISIFFKLLTTSSIFSAGYISNSFSTANYEYFLITSYKCSFFPLTTCILFLFFFTANYQWYVSSLTWWSLTAWSVCGQEIQEGAQDTTSPPERGTDVQTDLLWRTDNRTHEQTFVFGSAALIHRTRFVHC